MRVLKFVLLVVVFGLLFSGCFGGGNIEKVKNGVMNFNKSITIGQALDNHNDCKSKEWEELKTTNGQKIVEFRCESASMKIIADKVFQEKNKEYANLNSVTQVFQWTINLDDTFQLSYAGSEYIWKDGKSFSDNAKKSAESLSEMYKNEKFSAQDLTATDVYQMDLVFAMLYARAK